MTDIQRANAELACREYSLVIDELFDAGWPYEDVEEFAWRLMLQIISRADEDRFYPGGSDCGCLY